MSKIIFLYVKQHSITRLKYFGKTTSKNPFKYPGSGEYWTRHIKHNDKTLVRALEIWGFDDEELCCAFAIKFSRDNDIVKSKAWANLREETGLDSGYKHQGYVQTEETKIKRRISWQKYLNSAESLTLREAISRTHKGKPKSKESNKKRSESLLYHPTSPETKDKISRKLTGIKHDSHLSASSSKSARASETSPSLGFNSLGPWKCASMKPSAVAGSLSLRASPSR